MDDFTLDIRRSLDDAVDAGESLSFRYLNERVIVCQMWDRNPVATNGYKNREQKKWIYKYQ